MMVVCDMLSNRESMFMITSASNIGDSGPFKLACGLLKSKYSTNPNNMLLFGSRKSLLYLCLTCYAAWWPVGRVLHSGTCWWLHSGREL